MHQYEDLLVDALLDRGFTIDEAMRLIELQNRFERESQSNEGQQWMAEIADDQAVDE